MLARNTDAVVDLAVRISYGPEAMWRAMTKRAAGFAVADITIELDVTAHVVRDYLRRLIKGGYVQEIGLSDTRAQLFAVIVNPPTAPRLLANGKRYTRGMLADHLWRTLKMTRGQPFDVHDLAVRASTDEVTVKDYSARKYIQALEKAGYVQRLGTKTGPSARYRMMPGKNTGPVPPAIHMATFVYDANVNRVMGGTVSSSEVAL